MIFYSLSFPDTYILMHHCGNKVFFYIMIEYNSKEQFCQGQRVNIIHYRLNRLMCLIEINYIEFNKDLNNI